MRISDWSSDVCSSDLPSPSAIYLSNRDTMSHIHNDYRLLTSSTIFGYRPAYNGEGRAARSTWRCRVSRMQIGRASLGKVCVSTCSSRWSQYHYKKNTYHITIQLISSIPSPTQQ